MNKFALTFPFLLARTLALSSGGQFSGLNPPKSAAMPNVASDVPSRGSRSFLVNQAYACETTSRGSKSASADTSSTPFGAMPAASPSQASQGQMNAALGTINHGESWLGISTNGAVHFGVVCDASRMKPIVGTRYRRMNEDYDLCEAEFIKLPEDERAIYVMIARPGARPLPYTKKAAIQINQGLDPLTEMPAEASTTTLAQPGELNLSPAQASSMPYSEVRGAPAANAYDSVPPPTKPKVREPAPRISSGESWLGISSSSGSETGAASPAERRGSRSFLAASMRASESEHRSFWGSSQPAAPKTSTPQSTPATPSQTATPLPAAAPSTGYSDSVADHLAATAAHAEDQVIHLHTYLTRDSIVFMMHYTYICAFLFRVHRTSQFTLLRTRQSWLKHLSCSELRALKRIGPTRLQTRLGK